MRKPNPAAVLIGILLSAASISAQNRPAPIANDGLFAFQNPRGTFLSAAGAGGANTLKSGAAKIGQWEQFRLISLGGSTYAIQVFASGRHLTAIGGGGVGAAGAITTNAADVGKFEKFTLACSDSSLCALRTADGYYLAAAAGGSVRTDAKAGSASALFRLLTPQKESQATQRKPPAGARAKSGTDLGLLVGPLVLGAVGVDRFGLWEEAASQPGKKPRAQYDHLVVASPPGGGRDNRFFDLGSTRGIRYPNSYSDRGHWFVEGAGIETEPSAPGAEDSGGPVGASGEPTGIPDTSGFEGRGRFPREPTTDEVPGFVTNTTKGSGGTPQSNQGGTTTQPGVASGSGASGNGSSDDRDLSGTYTTRRDKGEHYQVISLTLTKLGDTWRGPIKVIDASAPADKLLIGSTLVNLTIKSDGRGGYVGMGLGQQGPVTYDGTRLTLVGEDTVVFIRSR